MVDCPLARVQQKDGSGFEKAISDGSPHAELVSLICAGNTGQALFGFAQARGRVMGSGGISVFWHAEPLFSKLGTGAVCDLAIIITPPYPVRNIWFHAKYQLQVVQVHFPRQR